MTILYATDGSEGARSAGHFLAALDNQTRRPEVHIITVTHGDGETVDAGLALAAAQNALGGADFPGSVTSRTIHAATGRGTSGVVEAIVVAAEATNVDLIVLGSRGLSDLARFFIGSVAEGVARHAPCPVLVARPAHGGAIDRVVVGVDAAEDAERLAFLPLPASCAVRLVSVLVPYALAAAADGAMGGAFAEQVASALIEERNRADRALQDAAASLTAKGYTVETGVREASHPAAGLIDAAREYDADLLVVGSRGLTGLDHFLLGSVSERVLQHAPCSVLIVRRRPGQE